MSDAPSTNPPGAPNPAGSPAAESADPPLYQPPSSPTPTPPSAPAPTVEAVNTAPVSTAVAGFSARIGETLDPTPHSPEPAGDLTAAGEKRHNLRIFAVANQKGGVGKTTTTVNLGSCFAELGLRTLIIDLDPQANASTGLGINPRSIESSMYDVLLHDTPLEDCIEATAVKNLFCAPASLDLAGAEIELVPAFNRERRLKAAIEAVSEDYDYVLIDCPPSLGLLTVNGLTAATEVLVPIQCEYYALEGLGQLLRNVDLVKKNLNPTLDLSTIVLVMFDARTKLASQVAKEVRDHFGPVVCRQVIPRSVRLSEAPSFGQPINVFDPTSRGALAYRDLAKEVSGVDG